MSAPQTTKTAAPELPPTSAPLTSRPSVRTSDLPAGPTPSSAPAATSNPKTGASPTAPTSTPKSPTTPGDWRPPPLARRSSYNYESDCAHLLAGEHLPGGLCCSKPKTEPKRPAATTFHLRRESFSREDQKHMLHSYMMEEEDAGFTSN